MSITSHHFDPLSVPAPWPAFREGGWWRLAVLVVVLSILSASLAAQDILIGSFQGSSVRRYDGSTGVLIEDFVASGSGGLAVALGVVFGPDGHLYVASRDTDQILRYDGTTGAFLGTFASGGGLDSPTELIFGPDGNLYVSSFNTSNVIRFNGTTGALIDVFTSGGSQNGAEGLTFGPDGNLYTTSPGTDAVLRYNGTTGEFIDTFVSGGGLDVPIGLVFGPAGNLYVASILSNEVRRFNGTTGALIDVFSSGGGLTNPIAVRFGPDGDLYVSSQGTNSILRYDGTTGDFIGVFGTETGAGTWFIFTADNRLYFAQFGNGVTSGITLKSDIVLSNPSATQAASATVSFANANGGSFLTGVEGQGIVGIVNVAVSPLDSITISTTGQGEFGTGTAVTSSDIPLGGIIRFGITAPPGIGSGIAGVPASRAMGGFVTPARRISGGINTGLAIRNVGSEEVNLTLSLRGENGVEVVSGSSIRAISGNGQLVDFINGLFPDADTDNFVGTATVQSDGMIAATAIEQGVNPGEFTTLPVTPLQ